MDRPELEVTGEKRVRDPEPGSLADGAWEAVRYNPYLSLAAGPVAGWLTGWALISAWDPLSVAGAIFQ